MKMIHNRDMLSAMLSSNVQTSYFFLGRIWGLLIFSVNVMQIDFKLSKDQHFPATWARAVASSKRRFCKSHISNAFDIHLDLIGLLKSA